MNKEVDKDLTMIQPEPTAIEKSFDELLKSNPDRVQTYDLGGSNPRQESSEVQRRVQDLKEQMLVDANVNAGTVDDLDAGRSWFESPDSARARNQNPFVKGTKAITGGIVQGGLIALEELGYVADVNTYLNMVRKAEDHSGNWWTNAMKEAQESVGESDWFKIYENPASENSLSSQIFKWTSLQSAVSSAVGFGITGMGSTKLVQYLGSTGRISKIGAYLDAAIGKSVAKKAFDAAIAEGLPTKAALEASLKAAQQTVGVTRSFVGPLASSMTANYFMGQLMGADTYKQSMEELASLIEAGEINEEEAQRIASEEANDVVGLNMLLTATAYLKFNNIFNRAGKIKGLVENPSAFNQIKNFVVAGAPTALTENIYQEMIQMEQIFDTKKQLGVDGGESDNYWDRMASFAISNRALHAGALGVVGGPIQFAMIQRPFMGAQLKRQKETYKKQQENIGWHEQFIANNFKNFKNYETAFNEAIKDGDVDAAIMFNDMGMIESVADAIEWGTIGAFKHDVEKLSKMTPEEAAAMGYDTETYQETASQLMDVLKRTENYLSRVSGAPNKAEIVRNMLFDDRIQTEIKNVKDARKQALENTRDYVASKFVDQKIEFNEKTGELRYERDPGRFDNLSDTQQLKLRREEAAEDQTLKNIMSANKEYAEFKKLNGKFKKLLKFQADLNKHWEKITSPKYMEDYAKKQDDAAKTINIKTKEGELKSEDEEDADTNFTTEKEIRENNPLTQEQIDATINKWDEVEVKKNHAIKDGLSFSGVDMTGDARVYTPDELVRSIDGRVFKVLAQNTVTRRGKSVSPEERSGNMPLLLEVKNEKGEALKGAKPFALMNNNFLRPETLLPIYKINGDKGFGYESQWGTYVKPDSLLKANNLKYQLSRVDMAERGEVAGVNVPASLIKKGEVEWLNDYNHHLLSLPFEGEQDVYFKLHKVSDVEIYVDVYLKEGDVKLTRINRTANLNYSALTELISANKSQITGKLVGHYSSNYNLVKHYDANNNPIYYSLRDLTKTNPQYLVNGKLILAQNMGDAYGGGNVAVYSDGTEIVGNQVTDEATGELLDIPYVDEYGEDIMRVGNTYALIKSPGGRLIPILLHAQTLDQMPSTQGNETFLDDFVQEWSNAVDTWVENQLGSEEELTRSIMRDKIENNPEYAESDYALALTKLKNDKLWEIRKSKVESKAASEKNDVRSVFENYLRPHWDKFSLQGKFDGKEIYDKDAKGKKVVNPRYFVPDVVASKTSGKFVPAIKRAHPKFKTKIQVINLEDHRGEFLEELAKHKRRVSISQLAEADANTINDIIDNQGLQVDIDPTTPFAGASGTFKIDSEEFFEKSAEAAKAKHTSLNQRFSKAIKKNAELAELIDSDKEAKIEAIKELHTDLNNVESDFFDTLKEVDDAEDIRSAFETMVDGFDLIQNNEALQFLRESFDTTDVESLPTYSSNKDHFIELKYSEEKAELYARGLSAIDVIVDNISKGEYSIKRSRKFYTSDNADFTQPENITFKYGNGVYNTKYGEGTYQSTTKEGMYKIKLKSGKVVYDIPANTYRANGPRHELAKINRKLSKTSKDSAGYDALNKQKAKYESLIAYISGGINKTSSKGKITADTIGDTITNHGLSQTSAEFLKSISSSDRGSEIVQAEASLLDVVAKLQKDKSELVSDEMASNYAKTLVNSLPYTQAQLQALIDLTEDNIENSINVTQNRKALAAFKTLLATREVLDNPSTDFRKPIRIKAYKWFSKDNNFREFNRNLISSKMTVVDANLNADAGKAYAQTTGMDTHTVAKIFRDTAKDIVTAAEGEALLKADLFATEENQASKVEPSHSQSDKGTPDNNDTQTKVTVTQLDDTGTTKRRKAKRNTPDQNSEIDFNVDVNSPTSRKAFADQIAEKYGKGWFAQTFSTYSNQEAQNFVDEFQIAYTTPSINEVDVINSLDDLSIFNKDDEDALNDFIDNGPKFKAGDKVTNTPEEFDAEVRAIKELLPQVPVEVVEDVTAMVNRYGRSAIGAFDAGIRTLVRNAEKGTGYHESFHAVAELYLTMKEKSAIAKENGYDKWSLELEEKLADRFQEYMNNKTKPETLGQRVRRFFKNIIAWFKGAPRVGVTRKIFDKIATKGYANNKSLNWQRESSLNFSSVEDFVSSVSEKNGVLLRKLLNDNKIEIVC